MRHYEITNHLGNVMATISDRKLGQSPDGDTLINYYHADLLSAQDYYPGGMLMPGRSYSSNAYRFGFNGKENDNEVKGTGNQQDYGMRIYDPRAVRFLSVDPITKDYPELTPYQFASNSLLMNIDIDGLEGGWYGIGQHIPNSEMNSFVNGYNKILNKGTLTVVSTTASLLSGPTLLVTAVTMPIVGNIVQGTRGGGYPSWAVPYTLNNNFSLKKRPEMMGEQVPWKEGKELMSATLGVTLPPIAVEGTATQNILNNFFYQTAVSESVKYMPPNNSTTQSASGSTPNNNSSNKDGNANIKPETLNDNNSSNPWKQYLPKSNYQMSPPGPITPPADQPKPSPWLQQAP